MKELFKDILGMEGVTGVLLLSPEGELTFKEMSAQLNQKIENQDWRQFIEALDGIRETDLVFENARIYICLLYTSDAADE